MTTLGRRVNIRFAAPDFEPEGEWKTSLRQRIEDSLKPAAEKLKRELTEKLKALSPPEVSKAQADYDNAMGELRRTANEQYHLFLERERQERRWAAGEKVDEKWAEILMKEQQALSEKYKKGSMGKYNQPTATRGEGRSQPPSSAKAPDQPSLPEFIAKDRIRRPSNILAKSVPEDSPPTRLSLEDQESRLYSNNGSRSRGSNGPVWSSTSQTTWEIWKPSSNESTPSRTPTRATGGAKKPRRATGASIGINSSTPSEASPALPHPVTIPGTRRPSNILKEPTPEDPPPTLLSLEDRESRPYSSTGNWSRRSNGRDRSANFGSPPRPTPEIWKPSPNESTTSRTHTHATGGTMKPRRDTSASIGTTPSFPAIPEDTSLGTDRDQDNEKLWSGISRARQKSRKGSASVDDRVTVVRPFPDFKRNDSATTTFPLTPDSPYGIARDPSYTISPGRPIVNSRRSFTDEPRQPSRWYPPPQTSDPRHMKFKSPPRANDDGGFQSSSPGPGPRNSRISLEETTPISDTEDDSDDERKQSLVVESSLQKTDAEQMEGVTEQRVEARKEAEAKQREEELKRKEEEAAEEARRKDGELRRSFTNKQYQPSRPQRTPSPTTPAWGSSSTTPTPDEASDSSTFADPKSSACRRLISHTFSPHEIVSLIQVIFTSKAEINIIRDLRGDDAQTFIDVVHGALDLPDLLPWLRKKCLSVLCKICGRQAMLPKSLRVPLCYDRSGNPLYRGGYADVWKGEHRGRHVAVKVLRVYSTSDFDKITSRFCKEVVTWKALDHPNVLPLLGVTMGNNHFAMASEWMVNGNINEYIRTNGGVNRFELLKDVARGLIYVHDQAMIHGDLKGANILVDKDGLARLADFGLLTIVSDPTNYTASSSVVARGTTRWMSPELLDPDQFESSDGRPTRESDCYALGMVIYEVLSGKAPFAPLKEFIVMRKVLEGERPSMPEGAEGAWFTDELWTTLNLCWATLPEDRLGIEAVLERLSQASGIWEPPSPRAKDDSEEDDSDWDLTTEVIHSQASIPVHNPAMSTSAGRSSTGGQSANSAVTSGISPYQTTSIPPEEREKRQQEHIRKQEEQFRREQEQFRCEQERKEQERRARTWTTLNEREIAALFAEHDRQWTRVKTLDDLGWDCLPWPMFRKPTEPEELTSVAICAYVLSPHHPTEKSKAARDRVKDHLKRWHPDRFQAKLLRKIREEEREKVQEGAGLVARNLSEMLTRSNTFDVFS